MTVDSGRKYDLLIFDWDGTLSNSAQFIVDGMQVALKSLGMPPRQDQQIAELIGLDITEGLKRLYPQADPYMLQKMLADFRRHWLSPTGGGAAEAPLFAGVEATLRMLYGQGYLLAIATGKSATGLRRSLACHAPIFPFFAATRTADQSAPKPNPQMLKDLLMELEVPIRRALMIGDTEYDAEMAQSIGMDAIGVACGVHDRQRIHKAGAQAVLADVAQLPQWLAESCCVAA